MSDKSKRITEALKSAGNTSEARAALAGATVKDLKDAAADLGATVTGNKDNITDQLVNRSPAGLAAKYPSLVNNDFK